MVYYDYSDTKQWTNKCPLCNAIIRWSLSSGKKDSKASAYCSNSIHASRLDIKALREIKYCKWEGFVVRQADGGIRFKDRDGKWIPEKFEQSKC